MKFTKWLLALAVAAPFASVAAYADDVPNAQGTNDTQQNAQPMQGMQGEQLKLSDLPSAVRSTVQKETKGKKVESITKEERNGKTIYNVEVFSSSGNNGQTLEISEAGDVLSRHMSPSTNAPESNPKD